MNILYIVAFLILLLIINATVGKKAAMWFLLLVILGSLFNLMSKRVYIDTPEIMLSKEG